MFRWTPFTFVRIVIVFIGGIILGIYQPEIIPLSFASRSLIALVVAYFGSIFFFSWWKFDRGPLALSAIFLAGFTHVQLSTESHDSDHVLAIRDSIRSYEVVITRFFEEKEKSWKAEARIEKVMFNDRWQRRYARIVLYFSKTDFIEPFAYGDVLIVRGAPRLVTPPSNPGEFDYKKFLSYRNIYHQHFLRKTDVAWLDHRPPSPILKFAFQARIWAERTLKRYVEGEREQGVAAALVLGVTDGLDNELLNAYAATGAMHVLAVSGLHITIVYMIIAWLFKPVLKFRSGPWLLAIVSLMLLWTYAFITGLSPSVLRAVTMFSFIAIAKPLGRNTNIFNTLGASAFCLLLFDPYLIMSVGFQLSYLAVIGIVYLQSAFYDLWAPRSYIMDEVWKITCVSIAAQIATFPLGLLYFHQFPNYFLLSNLLVIPGSFVVLIVGIVLLAFSFIGVVAQGLGFLLTWSIKLLNGVVFVVEAFPFSLLEDIHVTTFQCWLLMMAIIFIILTFEYKRFYFLPPAAATMIVFAIAQWHHHTEFFDANKLTVYNVQGHTAIDLFDHGRAMFFTDSVLLQQPDKIRFHIHQNRLNAGIGKVREGFANTSNFRIHGIAAIHWNNMLIAIVTNRDHSFPKELKADYLVISNSSVRAKELAVLKTFTDTIILDSSNSYFYCASLLRQSHKLGLNIHSVKHAGAFEAKI